MKLTEARIIKNSFKFIFNLLACKWLYKSIAQINHSTIGQLHPAETVSSAVQKSCLNITKVSECYSIMSLPQSRKFRFEIGYVTSDGLLHFRILSLNCLHWFANSRAKDRLRENCLAFLPRLSLAFMIIFCWFVGTECVKSTAGRSIPQVPFKCEGSAI